MVKTRSIFLQNMTAGWNALAAKNAWANFLPGFDATALNTSGLISIFTASVFNKKN